MRPRASGTSTASAATVPRRIEEPAAGGRPAEWEAVAWPMLRAGIGAQVDGRIIVRRGPQGKLLRSIIWRRGPTSPRVSRMRPSASPSAGPHAGRCSLALAPAARRGCGGSPTAPAQDQVFYLHGGGLVDKNYSWETYFKPLDQPPTERTPRIVGVGVLEGRRAPRPADRLVRPRGRLHAAARATSRTSRRGSSSSRSTSASTARRTRGPTSSAATRRDVAAEGSTDPRRPHARRDREHAGPRLHPEDEASPPSPTTRTTRTRCSSAATTG